MGGGGGNRAKNHGIFHAVRPATRQPFFLIITALICLMIKQVGQRTASSDVGNIIITVILSLFLLLLLLCHRTEIIIYSWRPPPPPPTARNYSVSSTALLPSPPPPLTPHHPQISSHCCSSSSFHRGHSSSRAVRRQEWVAAIIILRRTTLRSYAIASRPPTPLRTFITDRLPGQGVIKLFYWRWGRRRRSFGLPRLPVSQSVS